MPDANDRAQEMVSGMEPTLFEGIFVFVTTTDPGAIAGMATHAVASFQEDEGTSMIVPLPVASAGRFDCSEPMRRITLNVYSSLLGCGLTAAVSTALATQGIACNMVAAFHHDHVFVPADRVDEAMAVLLDLQAQAAAEGVLGESDPTA